MGSESVAMNSRVYVEESSLVFELRIHDVKEICKCPSNDNH
jgi:hypothetical protein